MCNGLLQGAATVKVTMESDSEGEEYIEEGELVVEEEQRPSPHSVHEGITRRTQVVQTRLAL